MKCQSYALFQFRGQSGFSTHLVAAIARGHKWLNELMDDPATAVGLIASR